MECMNERSDSTLNGFHFEQQVWQDNPHRGKILVVGNACAQIIASLTLQHTNNTSGRRTNKLRCARLIYANE
jgi:hypothetical protein